MKKMWISTLPFLLISALAQAGGLPLNSSILECSVTNAYPSNAPGEVLLPAIGVDREWSFDFKTRTMIAPQKNNCVFVSDPVRNCPNNLDFMKENNGMDRGHCSLSFQCGGLHIDLQTEYTPTSLIHRDGQDTNGLIIRGYVLNPAFAGVAFLNCGYFENNLYFPGAGMND